MSHRVVHPRSTGERIHVLFDILHQDLRHLLFHQLSGRPVARTVEDSSDEFRFRTPAVLGMMSDRHLFTHVSYLFLRAVDVVPSRMIAACCPVGPSGPLLLALGLAVCFVIGLPPPVGTRSSAFSFCR